MKALHNHPKCSPPDAFFGIYPCNCTSPPVRRTIGSFGLQFMHQLCISLTISRISPRHQIMLCFFPTFFLSFLLENKKDGKPFQAFRTEKPQSNTLTHLSNLSFSESPNQICPRLHNFPTKASYLCLPGLFFCFICFALLLNPCVEDSQFVLCCFQTIFTLYRRTDLESVRKTLQQFL